MGMADKAHADISATKTDTAGSGTAHFAKKDDGTVELTLNVSFPKMANKTVAVHLHEHGDCGDAGVHAVNPPIEAPSRGRWLSLT